MRYLFLMLLFALCINTGFQDSPAPKKEKSDYTLEAGNTKKWKSTTAPSPYAGFVDIFDNGDQQFLVMENRDNTAVEFYPWNGDSLAYAVRADSAELQEKCYMQGFYVASPDSVFIVDASNSKLHLLNKEGKLLQTHSWFSAHNQQPKSTQGVAGIYSGSPGIRQGEWLNLSSTPFSGSSDPSTFTKGKTNVAIHLKTGEALYNYRYPAVYQSGEYAQYYKDIKRCFSPTGKFLYSFGPEDSVRLTDLKRQEKAFYAGSSYFKTPPPTTPKMGNTAIPQSYGGILYDKENQVYYRMALHGLPNILEAENGFNDQDISIIILDKDFRKIGETLLPGGEHNFRQWFVGPDGLYISNHHPGKLSAGSGELSFTHYRLVPANAK